MSDPPRRLWLLAAALLAVAGCGGGSHSAARTRATSTSAAAPASAPGRRCTEPGVRAQAIRLRTSDGVLLSGAIVGSGPVGAVLIHEYPRDYCGWLPYSGYLARHGVRALLFDLRCFGRSSCPGGRGHATTDVAAAMAELRRRGAHRVALVGASMGGAIAVGAAAHGVTAPALFAVARGDRYVPVADMRLVARRARAATKRIIVLPAVAGHGWDLLSGTATTWSPLAATVAAFIRRHAGDRRV